MRFSHCYHCMSETESYPCPHCGYDPRQAEQPDYALTPETILNGRYILGSMLGQGGFGMTYVGWDLALQRKVALKEFFPSGQVTRSGQTGTILRWYNTEPAQQMRSAGMEGFLKEARKMALVSGIQEVARVLDVFQENDTAYIVMDFIEGQTLKEYLETNGALNWNQARQVFYPAIRAMSKVHETGLIHRDLSPDNIMLTTDGQIRLLDLGAAKDLNQNRGASSMLVAKRGFSPLEQYKERGNSGPWSDVYALAATMYYAMTLEKLPESYIRLDEDRLDMNDPKLAAQAPEHVRKALIHALAVRWQDRTADMNTFLEELQNRSVSAPVVERSVKKLPEKKSSEKKPTGKKAKKRTGSALGPLTAILVVLAVLLTMGVAGYFSIHSWAEADCTQGRTCRICGKTEGGPLGHDWRDANCRTPMTCSRCSLTQGEPGDHTWISGDGARSCTVCSRKILTPEAGSYLSFGHYEQDNDMANGAEPIEWLVLEVDGGRALLLSRYGLDAQPYHPENIDMTWADSFVRSWLNTEFLQQAFSPDEIDAILLTQVDNSAAQGYSGFTTGGGVNTQDQIFFLSYAEANRYLGVLYKTESGARDNTEARVSPTAYARAKDADAADSSQTAFGERTGWWWLRSPARGQDQAAYVGIFGAFDNSELDDAHGSVRPALWIDLEKASDLAGIPVDPYRPDADISGADADRSSEGSSDTSLGSMICKRIGHLWNSETPRVCRVCGIVEESGSTSGTAASSGLSASAVKAGSYVTFGSYEQDNNTANGAEPIEWLVLEVQGDKALVVSRYALDAQRYDENYRELTWEDCTLRSWLNRDFLNAAFTSQEQSAILTTEVDNSSSQCFDFVAACGWAQPVRGGNNTRDKLFLLSYGEASRYMNVTYRDADNMDARCAPTAYAIARGAALSDSDKTREGRTSGDWWLRSPGTEQYYGAYVLGSGQLTHLNYVVRTFLAGVRPAMWIQLN